MGMDEERGKRGMNTCMKKKGTDKKRSKKKGETPSRVILNPAHSLAYAIMNRRVEDLRTS
jgi:hypothetical protein